MKKCNSCNGILEDSDVFCRFCGKKADNADGYPEESKPTENITSLFLKYAGYMDANVLYKVALAKEKGLIKSEFPGEAEEIYKVLSFKGHLDSMYQYSSLLLNKTEPEVELAYKWLKIAAGKGHVPSINMLQIYNWRDVGVKSHVAPQAPQGTQTPPPIVADEAPIQPIQIPASGDSFAEKVNNVLPAIVMITSTKRRGRQCEISCGSGFVIENGYVITNAHVIGNNPDCIEARFEPSIDRQSHLLYPIAIEEDYDLAVLMFADAHTDRFLNMKCVGLNTNPVAYGQEVFTIGNPLGIGLSVSKGIVSCPDRASNYPKRVKSVIQTDITINHGNSGGALFDANNQVIGVATFVPSKSEGGIGMCIPAVYIKNIINKF